MNKLSGVDKKDDGSDGKENSHHDGDDTKGK